MSTTSSRSQEQTRRLGIETEAAFDLLWWNSTHRQAGDLMRVAQQRLAASATNIEARDALLTAQTMQKIAHQEATTARLRLYAAVEGSAASQNNPEDASSSAQIATTSPSPR